LIFRTTLISSVALFVLAGLAHGEDRDFDLPASAMGDTIADGGLELTDVDFEGNPLKRFAEKWPDDLVIAPVPGRSPQVGWSLALGGGYFLGHKDEDSEVAPSVLGGFGWYAENGSYAYGLGGNLHLLDDDLRVKFGAGYMDVRYRYYGKGQAENDLGISVDILQEAPMYFGSASYRVWKKLYFGLGFVAGNVDTRAAIVIPDGLLADPRSLDIGAITIPITVDTRDHEQFPRRGWLMEGRTMLYRKHPGAGERRSCVSRLLPDDRRQRPFLHPEHLRRQLGSPGVPVRSLSRQGDVRAAGRVPLGHERQVDLHRFRRIRRGRAGFRQFRW
jgi:hypothetical protein